MAMVSISHGDPTNPPSSLDRLGYLIIFRINPYTKWGSPMKDSGGWNVDPDSSSGKKWSFREDKTTYTIDKSISVTYWVADTEGDYTMEKVMIGYHKSNDALVGSSPWSGSGLDTEDLANQIVMSFTSTLVQAPNWWTRLQKDFRYKAQKHKNDEAVDKLVVIPCGWNDGGTIKKLDLVVAYVGGAGH